MTDELPYRLNVGAVLFNRAGLVFVGRRVDRGDQAATAWQLPQGGVDPGEDFREAVVRELREEIGTDKVEVIGEYPEWLQYDLPAEVRARVWGGQYRGQRQRWFALRFLGEDGDIALDRDAHPEFDAWRWVSLAELPGLAVGFKRPIYEVLARSFAGVAAG